MDTQRSEEPLTYKGIELVWDKCMCLPHERAACVECSTERASHESVLEGATAEQQE